MGVVVRYLQLFAVGFFPEGNSMGAYLLNGHHNLNGIQAVQAKVVGEVGNTVDLMKKKSISRLIGKHRAHRC